MSTHDFDHVIVGTGQALGTLLGGLLKRKNESICVIEGDLVGGSCVNYGCTPTKTLVANARAAHQVSRGPYFGVGDGKVEIDFARIRERMNEVRGGSRGGLERWLGSEDAVTFLRGVARFVDPRALRVGEREVRGERIYLNVGTRSRIPEIEGLDSLPWLDNRRILDLETLPEHLVIVGGGFVGLEFGQIFRRFGSQVTILHRGPQLLEREDRDVADHVKDILASGGVEVLCSADARAVEPSEAGGVRVRYDRNGNAAEVEGSHLLIAAGRLPNSDTLALEAAGIEVDDDGFIEVDDVCRTSGEGIYALGDVNGRGAFTHTSVNDAEIVLDHLKGGPRRLSDRIPIYALFIDPPLGRVGLTEKETLAQRYRVLRATRPMKRISRAKEMGETDGFAKLLVDADTDLILGVSVLGPGGDEIVNMFAAIMYSGIPCLEYRRSVFIHPTVSELMPWILDDLEPVEG